MRRLGVALLVLAVAPAAAPAQDTAAAPLPSVTLPPALDRVLRDYERAWTARDAQALAALFTTDGFVLRPGHPPVRGRDGIARAYAGAGGPLSLRAMTFAVGDTVGYIIGGYAARPGDPDDGKFVLAVRRDASGRWLIAADMDNGNSRR